jgi:hypothetical protein
MVLMDLSSLTYVLGVQRQEIIVYSRIVRCVYVILEELERNYFIRSEVSQQLLFNTELLDIEW